MASSSKNTSVESSNDEFFSRFTEGVKKFIAWFRGEPLGWKLFYALPALIWIVLPDVVPFFDDAALIVILAYLFVDEDHAQKLEDLVGLIFGIKGKGIK